MILAEKITATSMIQIGRITACPIIQTDKAANHGPFNNTASSNDGDMKMEMERGGKESSHKDLNNPTKNHEELSHHEFKEATFTM